MSNDFDFDLEYPADVEHQRYLKGDTPVFDQWCSILDSIHNKIRRRNKMEQGVTKQGVIKQARQSQSGKSVSVLVDEVWYSCKDFSINNYVGKPIIFNTTDSLYNGLNMHWINSFSEDESADALAQQIPEDHGNSPIAVPDSAQTIAGKVEHEPPMAFISNTVAHAILQGIIKDPSEVESWCFACTDAIVKCRQTDIKSKDFDTDIPF